MTSIITVTITIPLIVISTHRRSIAYDVASALASPKFEVETSCARASFYNIGRWFRTPIRSRYRRRKLLCIDYWDPLCIPILRRGCKGYATLINSMQNNFRLLYYRLRHLSLGEGGSRTSTHGFEAGTYFASTSSCMLIDAVVCRLWGEPPKQHQELLKRTCRTKCLIRRPPFIKPPFGSFRL